MAQLRRPSILLLFLGGSTIDDRGRRGVTVSKATDVEPWLAAMGEMDMIANTDGIFVHPGIEAVGLDIWAEAARIIHQEYQRYHGFVITHQTSTIPAAAVALSLMLPNLGKPVVLVGSPVLGPAEKKAGLEALATPEVVRLGAKANFINALQVAVSAIGEVVVVVGHQVYRGRTISGPLNAVDGQVVGKIDFGVRFFGQYLLRRASPLQLKAKFESDIAVIEYVSGLDPKHLARQVSGVAGIFVSAAEGVTIPAAVITTLAAAIPAGPILIRGRSSGRLPAQAMTTIGDRTSALIRFFWALGQSRRIPAIRQLMEL